MPKKRRQNKYNKPPSTAPALLRSTAASRSNVYHDDTSQAQGVNELLAILRRTGLDSSEQRVSVAAQPTVPPGLRHLLQIPGTPPRPTSLVEELEEQRRRLDTVRRLVAGPAPPRSWSTLEPVGYTDGPPRILEADARKDHAQRSMPGVRLPASRSLVGMVLREFARSWEFQKERCRPYLYELPAGLQVALIAYLAKYKDKGVSLGDLKAILLPPPDFQADQDDPALRPSVRNEDFHFLDLSWSLGRSLKLQKLSDLLFPPQLEPVGPQESWDAPEPEAANIPRPLLPNLTHLSLALNPAVQSKVSWRHLLAFATHLPGLTHLSLAFWPEPRLTPSEYTFTMEQSLTLSNWGEAIGVLRWLSRRLYRLEYLDISGCGAWFPALSEGRLGEMVDWVGAWGKITTLVLHPGYQLPEDAKQSAVQQYAYIVDNARKVEGHIRAQRRGKGRSITVETGAPGPF